MFYSYEGIPTLEEVKSALRTKKLTKSKDLRVDDSCEGLKSEDEDIGVEKFKGTQNMVDRAKRAIDLCLKINS